MKRFDLAIFEADELVYKFTAAATTHIEVEPLGLATYTTPVRAVVRDIERYVREVTNRLNASQAALAFSCPASEGFRRRIFPKYKSNRASLKPAGYPHVRAYLEQIFPSSELPWLEADDVLGMREGRVIAVSEDKDLLTTPGFLYRREEVLNVTEEQADYEFLLQTLTGDSTDGYPGCPKVGEVAARKLLDKADDLAGRWVEVVRAYEKQGLTAGDAVVQARCARILRAGEYNAERQTPILWTPPALEAPDPASPAEKPLPAAH